VLKTCLFAALILFPVASPAQDLSALQVAVEVARQGMKDAEADYAADVRSVGIARKNLEQAQKQLDEAREKAAASKKHYQEAKARFDSAQTRLNNIFKQ
jgi:5-bromo-4-chloroindolyl phosphate hydrolysis protein